MRHSPHHCSAGLIGERHRYFDWINGAGDVGRDPDQLGVSIWIAYNLNEEKEVLWKSKITFSLNCRYDLSLSSKEVENE